MAFLLNLPLVGRSASEASRVGVALHSSAQTPTRSAARFDLPTRGR